MVPIAQAPNVVPRYYHAHDFPAVDVALSSSFPNAAAQKPQTVQTFLQTTLQTALCVTQSGGVRVIVDNVSAGHFFPSGAAQDRRVFAEVVASKAGAVVYQSGVVPDGTPVVSVVNDPDLWLLRDCMFDASGKQVDMFWQAATSQGNELPMPVTTDKTDPRYYQTHVYQRFPRALNATLPKVPDQVTLRVRVQPIGPRRAGRPRRLRRSGRRGRVADAHLRRRAAAHVDGGDGQPHLPGRRRDAGDLRLGHRRFNVAADKYLAQENAGCSP